MKKDALVKNAASKKQVKDADRKEKRHRDDELNDLREVLSSGPGRRVLWRILSECSTFGSIWHPSAAIHYNSGKQDLGHWLMGEVSEANAESLFLMMKENYKQGEINV